MKLLNRFSIKHSVFALALSWISFASADNQTPTITPIRSDKNLPFRVKIEKANFSLPTGLQSYVSAIYKDKWLILAGRTSGLHGFEDNTNNFPPDAQNTTVYVVNPFTGKVSSRSLSEKFSGLTQHQIDLLSVTAAQAYQSESTLYITGGYGVESDTGKFTTKPYLTAIDVPGLIQWVERTCPCDTAAEHIRHIYDPIFQVTGGYMNQVGHNPTLLIVGQDFEGFYHDSSDPATQVYTEQVRRFRIFDDGCHLSFAPLPSLPVTPDPNLRRRDLNVVPVVRNDNGQLIESFVALSGVFTPTDGIWTVPVEVTADGVPSMADPNLPSTFKQGMNNYDCPTLGLFSEKSGAMFNVIFGGISFGFFEKNLLSGNSESGIKGYTFKTDDEIPFINQTTTIKINKHGHYSQHFMKKGSFPTILSKKSNPGNPLLFGAEAELFLFDRLPKYSNGVVKLDQIKKRTLIGYIVGGIQSTLPNTNTASDSAASPYIFKVFVEPVNSK